MWGKASRIEWNLLSRIWSLEEGLRKYISWIRPHGGARCLDRCSLGITGRMIMRFGLDSTPEIFWFWWVKYLLMNRQREEVIIDHVICLHDNVSVGVLGTWFWSEQGRINLVEIIVLLRSFGDLLCMPWPRTLAREWLFPLIYSIFQFRASIFLLLFLWPRIEERLALFMLGISRVRIGMAMSVTIVLRMIFLVEFPTTWVLKWLKLVVHFL